MKQEIRSDDLDDYTLYFIYLILIELRLRLIKAREKHGNELDESLSPIISNINNISKLIEEISYNQRYGYMLCSFRGINESSRYCVEEDLREDLSRII